jgi:hypothetical protein
MRRRLLAMQRRRRVAIDTGLSAREATERLGGTWNEALRVGTCKCPSCGGPATITEADDVEH